MERLFQLVGRYCFQGHTHVPGIFTESYQFFAPEEIDLEYSLGEGKLMVNVGSVGQPRDGDNRACYVVLEDGLPDDSTNGDLDRASLVRSPKIVYRRLNYDFEVTIQKIYSVPELEPFLGDRLRQGR
jgi:diadenosine tetraphosphatase ApaH/serine/threonine PP2A family protein phosphatase